MRVILLLALVAAAFAASPRVSRKAVRLNDAVDDLKTQLGKMTLDDILPPTKDKMCQDDDVSKLVKYANSDAFKTREDALLAEQPLQDIMALVLGSGCDYQKFVDFIQQLLACTTTVRRNLKDDKADLAAILAKVTLEQACPVYHDRLAKEESIACLVDLINQGEGLDDLNAIIASQPWADIKSDLTALKVNVDRVISLLASLTGIPFQ